MFHGIYGPVTTVTPLCMKTQKLFTIVPFSRSQKSGHCSWLVHTCHRGSSSTLDSLYCTLPSAAPAIQLVELLCGHLSSLFGKTFRELPSKKKIAHLLTKPCILCRRRCVYDVQIQVTNTVIY